MLQWAPHQGWSSKEILASITADAETKPSAASSGKLHGPQPRIPKMRGSVASIWECEAVGRQWSASEISSFSARFSSGTAVKNLDVASPRKIICIWRRPCTYQSAVGWISSCLLASSKRPKEKWSLCAVVPERDILSEDRPGMLTLGPLHTGGRGKARMSSTHLTLGLVERLARDLCNFRAWNPEPVENGKLTIHSRLRTSTPPGEERERLGKQYRVVSVCLQA